MISTNSIKLIFLTPVFILLAHYLAVFPHEYAHSITAWLLGDKQNPFAITYGGTHWRNILFLDNIDENVDYRAIISHGHLWHIALIGFAGPGITNGLFYFLSLFLLSKNIIKAKPLLFYFLFWFNLMNLGNFYDYVPVRTFASHSDIAYVALGLHISPWYLYTILGYFVAFAIWYFFSHTLIEMYKTIPLKKTFSQAALLILCVYILFKFFGGSGLNHYDPLSHFLSLTSILAMPGVLLACWPTREWVKLKLNK